MGKTILFSPIGGTDPISVNNLKDGPLLHICRYYKPDKVIMYMSAEILQTHQKDNRYVYYLEQLSEFIQCPIEYEIIERPELREVQVFDFFYNDFRDILMGVYRNMEHDDQLLLNVSSGTPAMQSALLSINTIGEFPFRAIQVLSPAKAMNQIKHSDSEHFNALWELNKDNQETENRCREVQCPSMLRLKNEEIIKRHICVYDYSAAIDVANNMEEIFCASYKGLLSLANARVNLDFNAVDRLSKEEGFDCTPIRETQIRKCFEYALSLEIKLKRKEYVDFVRGITPIILDLYEMILKNTFEIDIEDYSSLERGIRRWDSEKLRGTQVEAILEKEYSRTGGQFKNDSPIYSDPLSMLIQNYNTGQIDNQLIKNMRKIEKKVRNIAAHEIVSISDAKIKELSKFSGKEIMELMKKLFACANVGITKEMWDSYETMNQYIIDQIDGKRS